MEPILVVLIVFSSILFFTKMVLDHRRSRWLARPNDSESLGTSELQRLIRSAVDDAVGPVIDRLDRIEGRLPESETQLLLTEKRTEAVSEESNG